MRAPVYQLIQSRTTRGFFFCFCTHKTVLTQFAVQPITIAHSYLTTALINRSLSLIRIGNHHAVSLWPSTVAQKQQDHQLQQSLRSCARRFQPPPGSPLTAFHVRRQQQRLQPSCVAAKQAPNTGHAVAGVSGHVAGQRQQRNCHSSSRVGEGKGGWGCA